MANGWWSMNPPTPRTSCMWTVTSWSWPTQKFLAFPIGWWRWLPPVVWRRPSPPRRVCCWWCRPVFLTTCSSAGCFPTSLKRESCGPRGAIVGAVVVAGWLGIDPPGFVAEVVAFAFGLAASTFFPVIVLGIFSTRMNKQGGGGNGHGPSLYGQRDCLVPLLASRTRYRGTLVVRDWPQRHRIGGHAAELCCECGSWRVLPAPSASTQDMVRAIRFPKERVPRPRTDLESMNAARTPAAGRRCSS